MTQRHQGRAVLFWHFHIPDRSLPTVRSQRFGRQQLRAQQFRRSVSPFRPREYVSHRAASSRCQRRPADGYLPSVPQLGLSVGDVSIGIPVARNGSISVSLKLQCRDKPQLKDFAGTYFSSMASGFAGTVALLLRPSEQKLVRCNHALQNAAPDRVYALVQVLCPSLSDHTPLRIDRLISSSSHATFDAGPLGARRMQRWTPTSHGMSGGQKREGMSKTWLGWKGVGAFACRLRRSQRHCVALEANPLLGTPRPMLEGHPDRRAGTGRLRLELCAHEADGETKTKDVGSAQRGR